MMTKDHQIMSNQMTREDASRIQSATVRQLILAAHKKLTLDDVLVQERAGGDMSSGGFPARAQAAAAANAAGNAGKGNFCWRCCEVHQSLTSCATETSGDGNYGSNAGKGGSQSQTNK